MSFFNFSKNQHLVFSSGGACAPGSSWSNRVLPAVLLSLFLLGLSPVAGALALAEAEVNSALNQRLEASIPILFASPGELGQLQVKLRGRDADADAAGLRHELVREEDRAYLSVTSRAPISEPLVGFVLELVWPGGRFVREYVLLIHPPDCPEGCQGMRSSGIHLRSARRAIEVL